MRLNSWKTVSTLALVIFLMPPSLRAQSSVYMACLDSITASEKGKVAKAQASHKDLKLITSDSMAKVCRKHPETSIIRSAQAETPPVAPKAAAPVPTKVTVAVTTPKPTPTPAKAEVPPEREPDPTPAQLVADNTAPKPHVWSRKPFVSYDISREGLARALESGKDGDKSTLNLSASEFVRAMNVAFPNLRLENRGDLAEYIRRLRVAPLPKGKLRLATINPPNGTVDLKGWVRDPKENELGLYDPQTGKWILSLHCANIIPSLMVKGWVPPKSVSRVAQAEDERTENPVEVKAEIREEPAPDPVVTARRRLDPPTEAPKPTPMKEERSWRPGKGTAITAAILGGAVLYFVAKAASGPGGCSAVGSAGACVR